ncbi:glycerophosphodiester phosphodiesterase [Hwangdonia lutea]|uniref:Glycerophosphodiester phosphodiesterase family protein n=1 Tax=Hwangdonia lutea TaxID=3075823 RepID=A0AA97HRM3_9FLAO|nr:glycerophosphodiester phosphodiesterase family protein [Hwangdonia sp. SCSIO 19198]WOD43608.1 glycerophosphodiester phosphodiesterase family protein [Hwangdonia sp. SCSIO 19198]
MKKIVKIISSILVLGVVYVCLSISPIFFQDFSNETRRDFLITSHRGAAQLAPENTVSSVNAALIHHPNRIEIDVQQTKDEVVVLMHDTTLDRTTNGTGLVKENSFLELTKLDAGSWFSDDFSNERIPTLETIIKLIDGQCELIIEIKKGNDYYPNIEKNIVNIIAKYKAESWVIIHSFDSEVLKRVHQLNPNITLHKLFVGKLKFMPFIVSNQFESFNIDKQPYIKAYSINYAFANRDIINFLKSNGKEVNVWNLNNVDYARELISLGVDGIITDNPTLLKD